MRPSDRRRLVILTEGQFGDHHAKTAYGVIRYGRDEVVAVLDSTQAGRNVSEFLPGHDIPIVATLGEALARPIPPDALLIGIAPTGGKLPPEWRTTILAVIDAGLDVLSGLHTFLGDDPAFAAAAAAHGTTIVDYRRPPERMETAVGRRHDPGKRVILTVATDCAIGKMSVALELRKAAIAAGQSAVFVPTGQTGMMIEGWGVAVDRIISDFTQGTVEWLVEQGEAMGDWILVEGQGSLDHPAYSSVTLGLIHGATPHAMVMTYKPGMTDHDFDHLPGTSFPIAPLPGFIALHEQVAALVAPSRVVAVAVNTSRYPDDEAARAVIAEIAAETGLPADDPVRFGGERLWAAVRDGVDALPLGHAGVTLALSQEVLRLSLRDPFRIARTDHHTGDGVTTVIVELRDSRFPDVVGIGEGYPDRFYGETPETMAVVMPMLIEAIDAFEPSAAGLRAATAAMDGAIRGHGAAKCAIDVALHDLVGKVLGMPVHELLGLSAVIPPTDFTIGIDAPAIVAERARRAAAFPALKIKCGGPQDLETLRAVREVFGGPIRVDANTGWTRADAERLLPDLIGLGVELIEQPFPARAYRDLAWLQERSSIPIVADESAVTFEDLEALVGVVAGVNVKLAKCGGIGPARTMLDRARELGFKTFLGCMEETRVGIAGSAAVASLADWVDLDGCLLLADDPFDGLDLDADHRWVLPSRPGLGLSRRSA